MIYIAKTIFFHTPTKHTGQAAAALMINSKQEKLDEALNRWILEVNMLGSADPSRKRKKNY